MNAMERWLDQYFDEISPRDFYREIFPEGSFQKKGVLNPDKESWTYNGIIVSVTKEKREDGTPIIKRYTVTDDLDAIDLVCRSDDFSIMSPISYIGRERRAENARGLYAFAVDLDRMIVEGDDPVGLRNLWNAQIEKIDRIPRPTFIVSSGTGLHLYYVFTEPIAMYKSVIKDLQDLKRDLTTLIWHDAIVKIDSMKDIQQEGIYQGFRMPGTITKDGGRARAFVTGPKIDIETIQDRTALLRELREKRDRVQFPKKKTSKLTLAQAKELYPDWYERRIVQKAPRGTWSVNRALYEWWKQEIRAGATVGHRYYCLMALAMYAKKCSMLHEKKNPDPVTEEELERDAFALMTFLEDMTETEDNHFTEADVLDALEAFQDKWIMYPRSAIEYRTGITIPAKKRNGRKQADHLKRARAVRDIDHPDGTWREGNGRPSKLQVVTDWRAANPDGKKADCIRETGLSPHTVYKHWT